MSRVLEICCFSVADARTAQDCGADRIELCAGRPEDGTTPSVGMLEQALSTIVIPVFPMVRPRGGDFTFDADEFAAMLRDLQVIADLGFAGAVIGILRPDRTIDVERTRTLIEAGRAINPDLQITFHRAFDAAIDPLQSYRDVGACGANRVLTSGQQPTALDGIELLANLICQSRDQSPPGPTVMPGAGIRPPNVDAFLSVGALEIHSTASSAGTGDLDPQAVLALAERVHSR